jgi:hypothetical protein
MDRNSPGGTVKETLSTATKVPVGAAYSWRNARACSTGLDAVSVFVAMAFLHGPQETPSFPCPT